MSNNLERQRRLGSRLLIALLWLHLPINALAIGAVGEPVLIPSLFSAALAAAATLHWRAAPEGAGHRMTIAAALMGTISVLVAGMDGHTWQIDIHMYYFAALALLMVYCDWRTILAGAAVVAVHHLLLNFVLPSAIYPGGANLGRVVLHAVVLLIEAGALITGARNLARIFEASETSAHQAREALARVEAAQASAAQARDAAAATDAKNQAERAAAEQERAQVLTILAGALERVAARDLAVRLDHAMPPQYERLRTDFNRAMTELQEAMQSVAGSALSIRTSSSEVSVAADALSRRSEQQAAALEETAAALDTITQTVKRTADGAREAREVVTAAKADAEQSGRIVGEAVAAMGKIEGSAREIEQIIGVINEIAFQTNLLALNAGVEAARAGDAGKGFAVVASEVRALAQRSADAAKEIRALISASGEHVGVGVGLVGQTGEALDRIVGQIGRITSLVGQIAASAGDQASGLDQVNAAVNQMDNATQQNVAMVEESTAANHALAEEAEALEDLIGRFNLGQPRLPSVRRAA